MNLHISQSRTIFSSYIPRNPGSIQSRIHSDSCTLVICILFLANAHGPLCGVHGDPPGVRRTPGSMRRKGVITRRGSCRGPLSRKAWCTGIHIKTIRYLRVVDSRGSPYATLYARRILVDPGPDPLDAWCLECFLFLFTRGWILVDPVQWITGIRKKSRQKMTTPLQHL